MELFSQPPTETSGRSSSNKPKQIRGRRQALCVTNGICWDGKRRMSLPTTLATRQKEIKTKIEYFEKCKKRIQVGGVNVVAKTICRNVKT